MKKLLVIFLFAISSSVYSQWALPAASPRQTVEQQFSISKIKIDYGRPGVKGRKIFGDLVPYGKVWRAGANSSTKITLWQNINFGGKSVSAGTYGLFIIPTENEWKIILNKDSQSWGAFSYDEKLNVVETTVPVQKSAEKQEFFEINLQPKDDNSTDLVFKWDNVKAVVPIQTTNSEAVSKIVEKLKEIKQIEKDASKI